MSKYSNLSQEAIQTILGIKEKICIGPLDMARNLKVTFFPQAGKVKTYVKQFGAKLKEVLISLGVKIIPYDKTLITITDKEGNTRIGAKKGISIIAIGEQETGNLPIDHVESFGGNPIVSILDWPDYITENASYKSHIDISTQLFASNMASLVICVSKDKWLTYSFNGSYPIYKKDENFRENVLNTLITKLAAPLRPPLLEEFVIKENSFNVFDQALLPYVNDLINSGDLLSRTGLYIIRKSLSDLSFRNDFYAWVGSLLLDKRNGMSYGFLSRQLPVRLPELIPLSKAKKRYNLNLKTNKDYFIYGDNIYILICINKNKYFLCIPEVYVLSSRSGSEKTKLDRKKDIIKMGLSKGRMILELPIGETLPEDYKPSFDTRTILAHAVANAIYASILRFFKPDSLFSQLIEKHGMALAHWHGYIMPEFIPRGWVVYGEKKPAVSCSTPQSAIYAFTGKERAILSNLDSKDFDFLGDVHIEPQHGVNLSWMSLEGLGNYLLSSNDITKLGNAYFKYYI